MAREKVRADAILHKKVKMIKSRAEAILPKDCEIHIKCICETNQVNIVHDGEREEKTMKSSLMLHL